MDHRDPGAVAFGTVVGGAYRVENLVGRGAFGAVYRARSIAGGAPVALKVLSSEALEHTGGVRRFRREAELVARLRHPNSVRLLGAGEDREGWLFIAFELLEGRSLEDAIASDGALGIRRAGAIALEIAAALEEAHGAGVVHRDVKPANVFLVQRGGRETVKLLDFGLAKSTNPGTMQGLTSQGSTVGTPMYIAPEQILGSNVGPQADLFAFGIVLAEMLHGGPIYDLRANPLLLMKDRISGVRVPIPPAVASSPLGPVVLRATELDTGRRFTSAAELARAIRAALPAHDRAAVAADAETEYAPATPPMRWFGDIANDETVAADPRAAAAAIAPTLPASPRVDTHPAVTAPIRMDPAVGRATSPSPSPRRRWMILPAVAAALTIGLIATAIAWSSPAAKRARPAATSERTSAPKATSAGAGADRTSLAPPVSPTRGPPRHYFTDASTMRRDCERIGKAHVHVINVIDDTLIVYVEEPPGSKRYDEYRTQGSDVSKGMSTEAIAPGQDLDLEAIDFGLVPGLIRDAAASVGSGAVVTGVTVEHLTGEATVVFFVQLTRRDGSFTSVRYDAAGKPLGR